ncbi:MAG: site-specific DNA-methyltransferase [Terricaulis sp.]|nr:site-specific DNA-methyltransferase [Terricaulis sp.]
METRMSRNIELVAVSALKPYARNARTHSKKQIDQIAASIKAFGFVNPILVDDDLTIIAGHGRLEAAKLLGLNEIPILRVSHLDAAQRRAYIIADNRLAEQAGWDPEILALELKELIALDLDIEVIGFETAELDLLITAQEDADPSASDGADAAPPPPASAITQLGDIWEMGSHRLVCGDALDASVYADLLGEARADLIFTDPPYNVRINGHAGGKGKVTRHEFAMASGEMSRAQFEAFLNTSLGLASDHAKAGAIACVCMDWRHIGELLAAAEPLFEDLKNICVWVKSNGGMGSLYRSQHELVCVFKKAGPPHLNNVQLGKFGRNRTNVWNYAGVNAFGAARDAELAMHPTVKPTALVEDAIKDVTKRGAIVLDPFGGSGTTLIAAQKCGRSARLIELDPRYCDVIVRRFQAFTGKAARLVSSGVAFDDLAERRPAATA